MPTVDQIYQQKIMDDQSIIKQMTKNSIEDIDNLSINVDNLSKKVDTNNTNVMIEINKANKTLEILNKKIDSILTILKNL
jgi:flagellar hook-basal body complex protein FliE